MKRIGIILTTYNAEQSLERLLQSLLGQQGLGTAFDYQWLIVDDCSTDGTTAILEQYKLPYEVNPTNSGGPNLGRNKALQRLQADFATIVDDDDEWENDKVQTLLHYSDKAPILSSGYTVIKGHTTRIVGQQKGEFQHYAQNATFRQILAKTYQGQTTYLGSLLFSTQLNIPFFELETGKTDYSWQLQLFHKQESVEVYKSLYKRYVHGNNLSLNPTYRQQDYELAKQAILRYASQYPTLAKQGLQNNAATLAKYFYMMNAMPQARFYFRESGFSLKNSLYWLTSFYGHQFVKRYFHVFG